MNLTVYFSPETACWAKTVSRDLKPLGCILAVRPEVKVLKTLRIEDLKTGSTVFLLLSSNEQKKIKTRKGVCLIVLSKKGPGCEKKNGIYTMPVPEKKNTIFWTALLLLFCQSRYFRSSYLDALRQVEAFESNTEFSRRELMDLRGAVMAHEEALELSRQEKIRYEEELAARQKVAELGRQELMIHHDVIRAWETFYAMVREELLELHKEFDAQQQVMELGRMELQTSDKTLKAMDAVSELSRQESMQEIEAVEKLSEKDIEAILEHNSLWEKLQSQTDKKELVSVIKGLFRLLLHQKRLS